MKNEYTSDECEYLIGDDTCSAVKEAEASSLRAEACRNEIKDSCCYKCSLHERCNVGCDLLEHKRQEKNEKQSATPVSNTDRRGEARCGECDFYLKSNCPRGYSSDQELWKRQEGCEIFESKQKTQT